MSVFLQVWWISLVQSLIRWFSDSFIHSLLQTLVYSLLDSLIHSFHSIPFDFVSFHVMSFHFFHSFHSFRFMSFHFMFLIHTFHSFIAPVIDSLAHWFIHSFVHSFIHAFIHSCIHSFTHSFTDSLTHSLAHSFIHWFFHWFIISLLLSLSSPFIDSFTDSLFIQFILWFMDYFIHRFIAEVGWLIQWLIHSFSQSFIHSLSHSFVHWFVHAFMSCHWHLKNNLLIRLCTSQPEDFIASASQTFLQAIDLLIVISVVRNFCPCTARHYWYAWMSITTSPPFALGQVATNVRLKIISSDLVVNWKYGIYRHSQASTEFPLNDHFGVSTIYGPNPCL